jgi:hypothetical protein
VFRLTKILLCGLALAAPLYAWSKPAWLSRAFVESSGYVPIGQNVYVDPHLPAAERQHALDGLQAARDRITALYGAPLARPVTIIAANASEGARFGLQGDVPGTAFVTAAGTQVVLTMDQFTVDVTAHELTHAEVADRLGFWARMVRLPVWFDEGVAVQLDNRGPYVLDCPAMEPERIRDVQTLTTVRSFWNGSRHEIVAHYQAAKCAAAQVLALHPPATLYASLARLRRGESFNDVFRGGGDGIE